MNAGQQPARCSTGTNQHRIRHQTAADMTVFDNSTLRCPALNILLLTSQQSDKQAGTHLQAHVRVTNKVYEHSNATQPASLPAEMRPGPTTATDALHVANLNIAISCRPTNRAHTPTLSSHERGRQTTSSSTSSSSSTAAMQYVTTHTCCIRSHVQHDVLKLHNLCDVCPVTKDTTRPHHFGDHFWPIQHAATA